MIDAEVYSWLFVHKEWDKLRRMPVPDKGFEDQFRDYLCRNVNFDVVSDKRDMGLGLAYHGLSDNPHELDVVCSKGREMFVFELKHYEVSNLTKEIVFTLLGKVMDFYLKNVSVLSNYRITPLLVTVNKNVDDSIRKLCIAYGVRLIEPAMMTLGVLDYFARDLYQKIPRQDVTFVSQVEQLVETVSKLREQCDYCLSDILAYDKTNGIVSIDLPLLERATPGETLIKIKECYNSFEEARRKWSIRAQGS